jgi:hypothetical protein
MNDSQPVDVVEGKKSNGRGKGWMPAEDRQLAASVLHVGQDSVHGADQKSTIFWSNIHANFLKAMPRSSRTVVACSSRWKKIQHDVNLFCGFFSQVTSVDHSGWGDEDYVTAALELFEKQQETPFAFIQCWRVLKSVSKWQSMTAKPPKTPIAKRHREMKQSISQGSDDAEGSAESFDDDIDALLAKESDARPQGCKKAKAANVQVARERHSVDAQRMMASAAVKRNELIEEQNTMALFAADREDPLSIEYFALMKQIAIQKLRKAASIAAADNI